MLTRGVGLLVATVILAYVAGVLPASAKVQIDVDLSKQHMHVVMPDGSFRDWAISSGRAGLDTPDGNFGVTRLDARHLSREYHDAPMPYAIFFDLKGHAIHGSYEKCFGRACSHGCVRLPVAHAEELFKAVKADGAAISIFGHVETASGEDGEIKHFVPVSQRDFVGESGMAAQASGKDRIWNDVAADSGHFVPPPRGSVDNPLWPGDSD